MTIKWNEFNVWIKANPIKRQDISKRVWNDFYQHISKHKEYNNELEQEFNALSENNEQKRLVEATKEWLASQKNENLDSSILIVDSDETIFGDLYQKLNLIYWGDGEPTSTLVGNKEGVISWEIEFSNKKKISSETANKATRIYRDFLNDVINVKKKYTNEEEITTALTNRTINSEEEGFDNRLSQDIQLISEDIARAIKEGDFIGIEPIRYFVEGGVFPWDKQTPEELDHQITKLENEIKAKFLLIKKASQGTVKLNLKKSFLRSISRLKLDHGNEAQKLVWKDLTGKTCENKNQDLERAVDNLVNQFNSQNLTELENICHSTEGGDWWGLPLFRH